MDAEETKKQAIEKEVEKLKLIDDDIYSRYGIRSGGQVQGAIKTQYQEAVQREIEFELGTTPISQEVIDELENENYHTLVEAITELGLNK